MRIVIIKLFLGIVLLSGLVDKVAGQHSLGVHLGGNFSTMDFNNNPDYRQEGPKYLEGFQGGLVYQYITKPHVGIRMELNYVQRGWNEKEDTITGLKYQKRINYLELPFLTHIYIGKKKFRMMFDLGPYFGYALSAREMITNVDTGEKTSNDITFDKDRDNRLDYGLIIGAGFEYRMSKGAVFAEARYTFGLGNISKEKTDASELSQNRVIAVQVGYLVYFGKKGPAPPTPSKDQP